MSGPNRDPEAVVARAREQLMRHRRRVALQHLAHTLRRDAAAVPWWPVAADAMSELADEAERVGSGSFVRARRVELLRSLARLAGDYRALDELEAVN